jgi:hypothetical protein
LPWPDQDPPTTDVILHLNVPCSGVVRAIRAMRTL